MNFTCADLPTPLNNFMSTERLLSPVSRSGEWSSWKEMTCPGFENRLLLLCYTQSCPTLCYTTDCSLWGSSVRGIFQARILEWVAIFYSKGISLIQGSNPCVFCVSRIGRWILCHWDTWVTSKTGLAGNVMCGRQGVHLHVLLHWKKAELMQSWRGYLKQPPLSPSTAFAQNPSRRGSYN